MEEWSFIEFTSIESKFKETKTKRNNFFIFNFYHACEQKVEIIYANHICFLAL